MVVKENKKTKSEVDFDEYATDLKRFHNTLNRLHTPNGNFSVVGEHTNTLGGLVAFMHRVIYDDELPYKVEVGPTRRRVRISSKLLVTAVKNLHGYFAAYSADLAYAPDLTLFFEHFPKHQIFLLNSFYRGDPLPDGRVDVEVANDFIMYLREQGNKTRIKQKIADWKRTTEENRARIRTYVPALFDKCGRLMIVRLDVNYRKAMVGVEEIQEIADKVISLSATDVMSLQNGESIDDLVAKRETLARVDIREVKKDLSHFFRNMRGKPNLFEHVIGYIWSIEFSRVGGHHIHLALFFDGSKVQKDAWYGDQIGRYIEEVVTSGRAVVHNCNRDREKYGENWAIGIVEHDDAVKREKLMRVLDYLAKDSQPVYAKPAKGSQLFGTGHLPGEKSKAGRPRKK